MTRRRQSPLAEAADVGSFSYTRAALRWMGVAGHMGLARWIRAGSYLQVLILQRLPGLWPQAHHLPSLLLFGRSGVSDSVTPRTAARQASLSITNSQSLLRLMSLESVMPSNHLFLCRPLVLLPSIFPSIRVFSNESALHIRWPNIGILASTSVLPMNI